MTAHTHSTEWHWKSKQTLGARRDVVAGVLGIIGAFGVLLSFAAGYFHNDQLRLFLHGYLLNFAYVFTISVGALFFIMIHHVTRGGWGTLIRRLAEVAAMAFLPLAVLFLPILLAVLMGNSSLYEWNDPEYVRAHPLVQSKSGYLNSGFWSFRVLFYFASWILMARFLYARSIEQDRTGNPNLTHTMENASAPFLFVSALTVTFAAFDWIMSLAPEWYSTIFGVVIFSGSMIAFFAAINVVVHFLQSKEHLLGPFNKEHRHDTTKLMFGFTCFWAYVSFSQYMLIWYANIPEETVWFRARQEHGWQWVSVALMLGHFFIPFLLLLSRYAKRNRTVMLIGSIWMLAAHYLDLYWIIFPQYSALAPSYGLTTFLSLVGIVSLYLAALIKIAGDRPLMPIGDPRLKESVRFHNI